MRFRYLYALYDYNLMFFNCTLGLAVITTRTIVWLIIGVLTMGRLDLCNLPSPSRIQVFDVPWHTYVALVMQDHRTDPNQSPNPASLCCVPMKDTRIRAHIAVGWRVPDTWQNTTHL